VSEIEPKIRHVKERLRGLGCILPFNLSKVLVMFAVLFIIGRLNWVPTSVGSERVSSNQVMLGRKLNMETDLDLSFGEYVEAHSYDTISNTRVSRTEPCIALMPDGNRQGTWWLMQLKNWEPVRRDRYTKMPMPDAVIAKLNAWAVETRGVRTDPVFLFDGREMDVPSYESVDREAIPSPELRTVVESSSEPSSELPFVVPDVEPPAPGFESGVPPHEARLSSGVPTLGEEAMSSSNPEVQVEYERPVAEDVYEDQPEPVAQDLGPPPVSPAREAPDSATGQPTQRQGLRPRTTTHIGDRPMRWEERRKLAVEREDRQYGMRISVTKALKTIGKAAVTSIAKELVGIHNAKGWKPIRFCDTSRAQRAKMVRSFLFLKEKYTSTGDFEKLKARLVAGGHMQDRSEYTEAETSSPTVSLSSLYIVASIAAKERRTVATADVGQAFLKATLNREVLMSLEPRLAAMLAEELPEYLEYINEDGSLTLVLQKALYGLIESSLLWYEALSGFLKDRGFVENPKDRCVLNAMFKGDQLTVAMYVDDLFITCANPEGTEWLLRVLKDEFKDLSETRGTKHSFLGQTFDFAKEGECSVTMAGYTQDLLEMRSAKKSAVTPALEDLFIVNDASPRLSPQMSDHFHSVAAKAYYLALRTRPDLLTVAAFLVTRVQAPTEQDMEKLDRMLAYLNGTRELGIRLGGSEIGPMTVTAYVDASYGVHWDFKSHTGCMISVTSGPVHVSSKKHKLNSKSSTEAELIGVSDSLSQVIWTREFLIAQGYDMPAAVVKQDNQSTIVLGNKGRSTSSKTRHIGVRYFWVQDRIERGEVELEYLPTEDMAADILTKPLQGALFRKMRALLMNLDL
jgi:hypothetical protein